MTEREIREVREQWDEAHTRLVSVRLVKKHTARVEASLVAECERLAELIAEHDHAPIMTVVEPIAVAEAAQEQPIVITEDDGDAE